MTVAADAEVAVDKAIVAASPRPERANKARGNKRDVATGDPCLEGRVTR